MLNTLEGAKKELTQLNIDEITSIEESLAEVDERQRNYSNDRGIARFQSEMEMMFVLDKVNLASHMRQSSVPLLNAFSFFLLPLFKQIIRENNFNLELLLIYNIKVMFGKICDLGVMSVKNFLL